ncbi:MBL fold hydrolase [Paenibacillus baekrokdamisoli]|uniref:MBL fold hydrolase n=1 Tax=Paenibacillus baekrokdamisoli TaxID=1712516 RepID=A0A3G9IYE5_9BACL|nr:MBL fold metallo-hydrolase [Paenibacillus baekrokdamisoli]MBB3070155.1 ribonuclease BN (tRNA processing enzyme) [Paenibacillus baekrokdamisoli]BBH21165.1 MBL fold hydrolase [Paenibacillus baekrokdamisoli]
MNLQMLGTGSAFAKKYFNNNALFYVGDRTIMLDCGITAPLSLYQLGKTFNDIDALLISHIHADHIGGMEEFAFQMKFVYNRKPLLFISEAIVDSLWENALKGGLLQEECHSLDHYFDIKLLKEGVSTEIYPGFCVEPILTKHIPNKSSFSFLINGNFFYSADMRFDPDLLEELVARGCETIFHDCQLTPPGVVHTTLEELLTLPESIQERIWLMHYDDSKENYEQEMRSMQFVEQHRIYSFE